MRLKETREALGWSQVQLDRKAKLPRGTVNDIESGRNANPSLDVAFKILDAFRKAGLAGVNADVFRSGRHEVSR